MHRCGACGLFKPLADFYRDVRFPDEWIPRSACKTCLKAKRRPTPVHWVAKVCNGCRTMKPLDAFFRNKAGKALPPCKDCRRVHRPAEVIVPAAKRCSGCGETKPAGEFRADPKKTTGLTSQCIACQRAYRPAVIVTPEQKYCPGCKTVKPAADFYKTDRTPDGLYAQCRTCHNQQAYPGQKRYKAQNPEKVSEWNRQFHSDKWTPEQKAEHIAKLRAWNAANPESRNVQQQRRRARKIGSEGRFTHKQWEALKIAYGYKCAYCGKKTKKLTMDHVIPLARGGKHDAQNIVPACGPCNSKKHTRPAPTHQTHFIL